MSIVERALAIAETRGLKQVDLARAAGVEVTRLSEGKRGKWKPNPYQTLRLARAVGVSVEYLIDETLPEGQGSDVTADEWAVVELMRALGLSKHEALRRLSTKVIETDIPKPSDIGMSQAEKKPRDEGKKESGGGPGSGGGPHRKHGAG